MEGLNRACLLSARYTSGVFIFSTDIFRKDIPMTSASLIALLQAHNTARGGCTEALMDSAKSLRRACIEQAWAPRGKRVLHKEADPLAGEGLQDRWQFGLTDPSFGLDFDVQLCLTTLDEGETAGRKNHHLTLVVSTDDETVLTRSLAHFYSDQSLEGQLRSIREAVAAVDTSELLQALTDYATP